jgi:hypothetical protein
MTCDEIRPRLTTYLDGELEGDRGTVVRGHLRTCDACRQVATDEAALRDGLRALPTLDPPSTLWAGVQAQLANEEVAESRRPAWRRALSRWSVATWQMAPRFAAGGLVAATVIVLLWWRPWQRDEVEPRPTVVIKTPSPVIAPQRQEKLPAPPPSHDDVTADLAAEPARVTDSYEAAATELIAEAATVRASWPVDQQVVFDAQLVSLRAGVSAAVEGRPRQQAWRAVIRYVQRAMIRDEVLVAGVTP